MNAQEEFEIRKKFENIISASPFERDISRKPNDPTVTAWPGNYQDYNVQLAWELFTAGDSHGYERGKGEAARWQPIEAAPRDRTMLLLCWYSELHESWNYEAGPAGNIDCVPRQAGWLHGQATHWMPLPIAPITAKYLEKGE